MDAAVTVIGTGLVAAIGALIHHMLSDAKTRQELTDLKARVAKLDGINGR